ncbi:MAG: hypothetical protein JNL98_40470, partial [Bryobacterales bacterium]|nr:hypothetical protein [Bryobacterales bacterium]
AALARRALLAAAIMASGCGLLGDRTINVTKRVRMVPPPPFTGPDHVGVDVVALVFVEDTAHGFTVAQPGLRERLAAQGNEVDVEFVVRVRGERVIGFHVTRIGGIEYVPDPRYTGGGAFRFGQSGNQSPLDKVVRDQ